MNQQPGRPLPAGRRADTGTVRLTGRDITGLILAAEQYAPATIRETLYAAFDIQCLYRQDTSQVTIWATITDTTPAIIAALLTDPRTDSDTAASTPPPAPFADLQSAAIAAEIAHIYEFSPGGTGVGCDLRR